MLLKTNMLMSMDADGIATSWVDDIIMLVTIQSCDCNSI